MTFASLLGKAFDPIVPNAAGNVEVLAHLLDTLDRIAGRAREPQRVEAVVEIVQRLMAAAEQGIRIPEDYTRIARQATAVVSRWAGPDSGSELMRVSGL